MEEQAKPRTLTQARQEEQELLAAGGGTPTTKGSEALQAAWLRAELARARKLEEANERALRFLDETAAALSNPQAECNVCLEPLRGKQVAVLQCLHAFCGPW